MGMKKLIKLNNYYFICDELEMEINLNENKFPSHLKIAQFVSLSRSNTKGLLKDETIKLFRECNPKMILKKRVELLTSELNQEDFFPLKILDSHGVEKEIFISKHKGYDLTMISHILKFNSLKSIEYFFFKILNEIFSKNVEFNESIYDIKLENILVTRDYDVNLIDFVSFSATNYYIFQKKLCLQLKRQETQESFIEFLKQNQKILLWNNILTSGVEDFYKFIQDASMLKKLPYLNEKIREFKCFVEDNEKNLKNWIEEVILVEQKEGACP